MAWVCCSWLSSPAARIGSSVISQKTCGIRRHNVRCCYVETCSLTMLACGFGLTHCTGFSPTALNSRHCQSIGYRIRTRIYIVDVRAISLYLWRGLSCTKYPPGLARQLNQIKMYVGAFWFRRLFVRQIGLGCYASFSDAVVSSPFFVRVICIAHQLAAHHVRTEHSVFTGNNEECKSP